MLAMMLFPHALQQQNDATIIFDFLFMFIYKHLMLFI